MQKVLSQIARYKHLTEPVLILGESGTGKELAAQSLIPAGKSLVAVNCAKFLAQEEMFESEVFGHVKGAFSGATHDRWGLIHEAEDAVLFLDEVHALSLSTQQKLLRVLQDQSYRRVGEAKERRLAKKFRLIAAAKDDLPARLKEGSFLPDFYYRIHTLSLEMTPLRERLEDLRCLVDYFLTEISKQTGLKRYVRGETLEVMKTYRWPGNVRELKNCLYRISVDATSEQLGPEDFFGYLSAAEDGMLSPLSSQLGYREYLHQSEASYFKALMSQCSSTEELLEKAQVSKSTLYRKLSALGLATYITDRSERPETDLRAQMAAEEAVALRPL